MQIKQFKTQYKLLPKVIFCKSLNLKINITRTGFKHVFHGKMRKNEDIKARVKCLKYIPILLETINIYQFHTKEFLSSGNCEYWNIQGVIKGVCIHVTIRKIGNQSPHLYSWYWKGQSPNIIE